MDDGKTRFWREIIITVGILPGLWLCLGVDPEAQIANTFFSILNTWISAVAPYATQSINFLGPLLYSIVGVGSSLLSWIGVYQAGGGWGILVVLGAFIGGCFINEPFGIWLILASLALAPFLPVDREHSFDTHIY